MQTIRFVSNALVLSMVVGTASLALGQEYYRQNPVNSVGGYSSQDARNPGGLGWFSEVADNFPGEAGWSINRVEFWGGYASPSATPGNTRGFTIRFYTDNGGRPGTRVYEQDAMMFRREQYYETSPPPSGLAGYRYEVDLARPFDITTTAQYWITIVAILDRGGGANEPQWGWVQATRVTSPSAYQWFFMPGQFSQVNVDEAFVLSRARARCVADVDDGTGTGTPDGGVTIDDLFYYLNLHADRDTRADIDNGTFTGTPDGGVTIDDLLYYLFRYDAGC